MSREWILKALPGDRGLRIVSVDENGRATFREIPSLFKVYFLPKNTDTPHLLESLQNIPWVESVSASQWLLPPWYDRTTCIIEALVKDYSKIDTITGIVEAHQVAERVNIQPDPLSLSLKNAGFSLMNWRDYSPWSMDMSPPNIITVVLNRSSSGFLLKFYSIYDGFLYEKDVSELEELPKSLDEAHIIIALDCGEKCLFIKERLPEKIVLLEKRIPVRSLYGLMELSRLSYLNLDSVASASIGKVLTEIEALHAIEKRMIVPKTRTIKGYWRPVSSMIELDRGGLIGSPKPGVYNNVVELDFSSLYPSIIAKYNISPETIDPPICNKTVVPPGAPHEICMDRRGLVPKVVEKLVRRREALRRSGLEWANERQEAIKWILVSSFGYLGYRNSRFGSLKAYETVTSISRKVMRIALKTAINCGYRVVHYIIDSLFLQPQPGSIGEGVLVKEIEKATGFKIKVEARFKWLIIPQVLYASYQGASNRYYGMTTDGRLLIKGSRCFEHPPKIPSDKETIVKEILLRNRHPRRLCEEIGRILEQDPSDSKPIIKIASYNLSYKKQSYIVDYL